VTPTVTDANVLLGYINPGHLVGGAVRLNADKARSIFEQTIARPLGMSSERAAIRRASDRRVQHDPDDQSRVNRTRSRDVASLRCFAFGGNGPLFACGMATALGMSRVVVPPCAGLFSSFGLLYADVEHHYGRTLRRLLRKCDLGEVEAPWSTLARQATEQLNGRGLYRSAGTPAPLSRASLPRADVRADRARPDGAIDQKMMTYLEKHSHGA